MSKESKYTKLQFKFDMGLGDNGKTKVILKDKFLIIYLIVLCYHP